MDKQQITTALARKYREEYAKYFVLERLAREALNEDDKEGFAAISKRAAYTSRYLCGIKKAAEILGIGETEFMTAVNSDKEVCHAADET